MEMSVNFYYDWTGDLSSDPEGNLVQLCRDCLKSYLADEHDLQPAQSGDYDSECEYCDARNAE